MALGGGEGFSGQHVGLHQIADMDPVHPRPAIPKSEHEKPLLNVALVGVGEQGEKHRRSLEMAFNSISMQTAPQFLASGQTSLSQPH